MFSLKYPRECVVKHRNGTTQTTQLKEQSKQGRGSKDRTKQGERNHLTVLQLYKMIPCFTMHAPLTSEYKSP